MALLFMDSFDHYLTADINEKWGSSGVSGASGTIAIGSFGRHSSSGFRWVTGTYNAPQGYLSKSLNIVGNTIIMGFAFNPSAVLSVSTQIAAILDNTATLNNALKLNSDLTMAVTRGAATIGTVSTPLSTGVFTYIECKIFIANSGGTIDVQYNGISVLSLTGLDTLNISGTSFPTIIFGQHIADASTNASSGRSFTYDDIYICDATGAAPWNNFLGDVRVDARLPTAAGTTTGWTPSSALNYQVVDDINPNDDIDYNSTSTLNAIDTFVTQDAPVVGATLYGIQHNLNLKKMDAGPASVAPVIRHSGTNNAGSNINPGTSYAYGTQIATEIAPGVAITEANFNAAEFGYKKTV